MAVRALMCLTVAAVGLVACDGGPATPAPQSPPTSPEPEPISQSPAHPEPVAREIGSQPAILADGTAVYGASLDEAVPEVALTTLLDAPQQYAGTVVRTRGQVSRVCQRMGCWMELAAEDGGQVRVPLAGHAFFVPLTVLDKPASVQGRVEVRPLSEAERRHLQSEGAQATDVNVSIVATAVAVR